MAYGRRRRKGRDRLMRMLGSATSARGQHIRKTRSDLKKDLELKARQRRAQEQRDYDKKHKWDWLGRGINTAMKVLPLTMGPMGLPMALATATGAGAVSAMLPGEVDPYLQQGLSATHAMMGHQQQMDLLDRQLANQERYTSSILQGLQRGGGGQYGTGQSFSGQGHYLSPHEDLGTIGRSAPGSFQEPPVYWSVTNQYGA